MARDSVLTRVATGAAVGGAIGGAVGEDLLPLFPVSFRCKTDSFVVASFILCQTRQNFHYVLRLLLILCIFRNFIMHAGAVYGTYDAVRYKVCR